MSPDEAFKDRRTSIRIASITFTPQPIGSRIETTAERAIGSLLRLKAVSSITAPASFNARPHRRKPSTGLSSISSKGHRPRIAKRVFRFQWLPRSIVLSFGERISSWAPLPTGKRPNGIDLAAKDDALSDTRPRCGFQPHQIVSTLQARARSPVSERRRRR